MKKIVIIDDNELILHLISRTLENKYEIHAFQSSLEGHEFIKENSPDLIILDIQMPDMDGFELCSQLKSNDHTKNIPVIIVSAKTGSNSRTLAYRIGAINYLEKPFGVEELRSLTRSIINQSSHGEAEDDLLLFEDITLNPKTNFCSHNNDEFKLTRTESIILAALIKSQGAAVSREVLASKLDKQDMTTRSIDTHVSSLRKKLKYSNAKITSVYGVGYQLTPLSQVA